MPGRLSSPRFRRRALRLGLAAVLAGSAALAAVLLGDTGRSVETPLHGRATLYVPPIPVDLSAAERRRVIATAARFVETAVRRDGAERAYDLVGPSLRAGTTRADWRGGDIPVVPYPVDEARWKFDYAFEGEIGLRVAVFPRAGTAVRPAVFDLALRAVGEGPARRWLVDAWSPHGGGGGSRPARSEGSPFRVDLPPAPKASTSLGAAWLLVPAALIALGLLVPLVLVAAGGIRTRRARRAWEATR